MFKFLIKNIPFQKKKNPTGSVSWYLLLLLHHLSNTGLHAFAVSDGCCDNYLSDCNLRKMEKAWLSSRWAFCYSTAWANVLPHTHSVEFSVTLSHKKPLKMSSYKLSKDNSCCIINAKWLSAKKRTVRNAAVCQVPPPVVPSTTQICLE